MIESGVIKYIDCGNSFSAMITTLVAIIQEKIPSIIIHSQSESMIILKSTKEPSIGIELKMSNSYYYYNTIRLINLTNNNSEIVNIGGIIIQNTSVLNDFYINWCYPPSNDIDFFYINGIYISLFSYGTEKMMSINHYYTHKPTKMLQSLGKTFNLPTVRTVDDKIILGSVHCELNTKCADFPIDGLMVFGADPGFYSIMNNGAGYTSHIINGNEVFIYKYNGIVYGFNIKTTI